RRAVSSRTWRRGLAAVYSLRIFRSGKSVTENPECGSMRSKAAATRNPFEYGRELGIDELVDRVDELREVAATIRNRAKLFVIGPDGAVTVSLGASKATHGELPLLTDALDAIEALAKESGREVAVILDEIQRVVVEHGLPAERQLRSTIQQHSHVSYVFAGSATRHLYELS